MTQNVLSRRRVARAIAMVGLAAGALLAAVPGQASAATTSRCTNWWTTPEWASSLWATTCIAKDGGWSYASVTVSNTGVIPIDVAKLTIYNTASGLGTTVGTITCGRRWVNPGESYSCMTPWAWDTSPTTADQGWSTVAAYKPSGSGATVNFASPLL